MSEELIAIGGVRKSYNVGLANEAEVLHGVSLRVGSGEFIALMGPSGSGKSTLLNIVGLLERMTSGSYRLQGEEVGGLDDGELTLRRRRTLGFVFQFHHLLPAFTALENVLIPSIIAHGTATLEAEATARDLLARVGLTGAEHKRPGELSGGMQQRVAIARSLALRPGLLLMDEPFGALDEMTRERMQTELLRIRSETGAAVVFVTHSIPEAVFLSDRVVVMSPRPGRIRDVLRIALPDSSEREAGVREDAAFFSDVGAVRELLHGDAAAVPRGVENR